MSLEVFIGSIVVTVIVVGAWMLVFRMTFSDAPDVVDEVAQERQFLEAVQRATRNR